jgi:actin
VHSEPKFIPTRLSDYILSTKGVSFADGSPPGRRCGHSADESSWDSFDLSFPVTEGIITDHEKMESLIYHTFYNELKCAPEEHPVLCSESCNNAPYNRAKTAEQLFEVFQVPSLCFAPQPLLAICSTGANKLTGTVIDGGHGSCRVTSIYDGQCIPQDGHIKCVSGCEIDNLVAKSLELEETGITLVSPSPSLNPNFLLRNKVRILDIARSIKERLCHLPTSSSLEVSLQEDEYVLPDGRNIRIKSDILSKCSEVIFTPSLGTFLDCTKGVHCATIASITSAACISHKDLCSNIVVTGGTTKMKGFTDRLSYELQNEIPEAKIIAPHNRHYSVWVGGALLATHLLSISRSIDKVTDSRFITKEEYDENGTFLFHK